MGILDVLSGKQQLAPDVRMGLLAAGVAGLKAAHEENNTGRTFARALPMYFQGKQQFQRQQDLRNLMGAGGTGINTGDPQAAFDRLGAYLAKHGTPEQIMQYQLKKMELQKPKEPLKRYGTPQVGINPQTGKPGQFVVDQYTGEQRWMGSAPYEKQSAQQSRYTNIQQGDDGRMYGLNNMTNQWEPIPGAAMPKGVPPPNFKDERDFRKEFLSEVEPLREVARNHEKFMAVLNTPGETGIGDVAATFNFMKSLDPRSVVRESEIGMLNEASGIKNKFLLLFDKYKDGKTLPDPVKREMAALSARLYEIAKSEAAAIRGFYSGMASDYEMPEERVLPGYDWNKTLEYSVPAPPPGGKRRGGNR